MSKAESEISSKLRSAYESDVQAMVVSWFNFYSRPICFYISYLINCSPSTSPYRMLEREE